MAFEYNAKETQKKLRKALNFAKANPNHPDSQELRRRMEAGQFNFELRNMGLPEVPIERKKLAMPQIDKEESLQTVRPQQKESEFAKFGARLSETAKERKADQTRIKTRGEAGEITPKQELFQRAGQAVGGALELAGETALGLAEIAAPKWLEDKVKAVVEETGDEITEYNKKFIQDLRQGDADEQQIAARVDEAVSLYKNDETFRDDVRAAGGILEALATATGAGPAKQALKESVDTTIDVARRTAPVVREGVEKTGEFIGTVAPVAARQVDEVFRPTEAKLEAKIDTLFTKAVRPTLRGKENIGQMEKSRKQAIDAVRTINENAPQLKYVDEIGEVVEGRSPESLREFSQAVDQTKRNIFEQYNDLAKQTGDAGITINPKDFADEFDAFINDKAVQTASPETIEYAKKMRDRYSNVGDLAPEDIENIIKIYNQDLQTFYRNPTADQGRKVAVDAMLVNNLRKQLDEAISKTTGEEYQALKNKYGALRSIEKDVLNATLRDARKNTAGLIDFTDIFSGGELAAGVISMNPAMIGSAAAQRGIKSYLKYLNDPNANVKKMFRTAETLQSRPEAGPLERAVTNQ